MQKASDESENVKWLMANTKKCPKCRSPIEKNGGCMHMTCRIASCAYEFCWLCRGPWTEHGSATGGYYQCNKYDASEAKKEDDKATDVKTELETYMFYFHRYESHKNAGVCAEVVFLVLVPSLFPYLFGVYFASYFSFFTPFILIIIRKLLMNNARTAKNAKLLC